MYASFGGHCKSISEETRQILLEHADSYYISLEQEGAYVFSCCAAGLFYGIGTLRQIVEYNDSVNCCEIIDYPDVKMRSAYFDFRQGFPKFENLISYIEMLAEFKTNTLMIEYEDKFPFAQHSFLKHPTVPLRTNSFGSFRIRRGRILWKSFHCSKPSDIWNMS